MPAPVVQALLLLALASGMALGQEETGGLRFAHQAADAPLVDVVVDGRALFRDVAFGQVSSYVPLAAGRHEVTVFPHRLRGANGLGVGTADSGDAGGDDGGSGAENGVRRLEPVTTFVTVEPDTYHTAVLTGFYEPPAPERQLGHLSVSVRPGETSLGITGPRGYAAEFTGDQLLTGIEPGTYTITADLEGYRPATYEAEVEPRRTTVVSIALQEAEDGEEATEASTQTVAPPEGMEGWATLQVQAFRDEFGGVPPAGHAKVRVVHASATSPELQIVAVPARAGAERVELGIVGYPGAGGYVTMPAGSYALRFGVADSEQAIVVLEEIHLASGALYTFFVTSEPAEALPRVVPTVDAMVVGDEGAP